MNASLFNFAAHVLSKKKFPELKKDWVVGINIDDLPPHVSGFQRRYIDEFLNGERDNVEGFKIVHAKYGHCMDYPKGFKVDLLLKDAYQVT